MQTTFIRNASRIFLSGLLGLGLAGGLRAADVFKADTANTYSDPLSWVGGAAAPGASDVAVWDSTVATAANLTNVLGADVGWGGIRIANSVIAPVQISAGNTLTLGASGIDMSAANQGLVLANALTLGAAQTWNVGSGQTLTASGAVAINSGLIKSGPGNLILSVSNSASGGVTLNSGTLTLNNANSAGVSTTLTINGGTLALNADPSSGINTVFGGPVQITIGANRVVGGNSLSTTISGNGTLTFSGLSSGRVFTFSGSMSGFTGTVDLGANGGQFRFNSGGGNPALGNVGATFNLGTSTGSLVNRNGATTYNLGALSGGSSTTVSGRSNGSGSTSTTYSIGALNTDTTFSGIIANGGDSSGVNIVKVGTGTLTLGGASTYTGNTIIQTGRLALASSGSIATSASITVSNGATFDVSAVTGFTLGAAQQLRGNGTVIGSVVANGTVSPGSSIGKLTLNNDLTLAGTTVMELNRTNALTSDLLNVLGTLTLGGTLNLVNLGDPLQIGDSFNLFDGTVVSGLFSLINPPSGESFTLDPTGQLTITAVPEPSVVALGLMGCGLLTWRLRRGRV